MTTPMPALSSPEQRIEPVIRTREQLETTLENIAQLQREREELWRVQEDELAAVRQKYRALLGEVERYLDLETSWVEIWARENAAELGPNRVLESAHATIGFRETPPRIERASRKWTWTRIALTLGELAWGRRYLRVPAPEVDKEAILADLAWLSPVELRSAGIKIMRGERFYISPRA